MATNIVLKRSSSSGAAPSTSDLELGEIALNTYDGKMYMKKTVSGTSTIVELTGSVALSSSAFDLINYKFVASSNQTTFTGSDANSVTLAYATGTIQVFLNGILLDPTDYTATNGSSVVLDTGATSGDILYISRFAGVNPFDDFKYVADANQTTFTGSDANSETLIYTVGNLAVYLNGVLLDPTDFTATNGSSVVLASGAAAGDILHIHEFNQTGLTEVHADTTPTLGGDLDLHTYDLVTTDNRNIDIIPHGTGDVNLSTDTVKIGASGENVIVTTNGTGDITLSTNAGTNSGTVKILDGANQNIEITPNGSGKINLDGLLWPNADGSANQFIQTDGSGNLSFVDVLDTAEEIADTVGAMVGPNTETGITVTYQDSDNTLDFALAAAQTTITSLLAADIKIGEDDQTKIDFETADEIHFYAANAHQIKLVDGALVPVTDNDIDLGTSSLEFKDAFFDGTVTSDAFAGPLTGNVTGNVSGTAATVTTAAQSAITSVGTLTSLAITGDLDIADTGAGAITVGGTTNTYNAPVMLNVSDIGLAISDGTKSLALWGVHGGSSHSGSGIGTRSNHDMFIATNDTKRMVFDTSGNVGIGVTDPLQALEVRGQIGISAAGTGSKYLGFYSDNTLSAFIEKSGDNMDFFNADAGRLGFATNNAEKMRIASDGKVGIGTTSPTSGLTVATSANITQVGLTSASNVTWDADAQANAYLLLGHNVTIGGTISSVAYPSNATEGQIISIEIAQGGTVYTVSWDTVFEFAASTTPTMTATANKTDIFTFRYNGSVWQEIGRVQNMAQT